VDYLNKSLPLSETTHPWPEQSSSRGARDRVLSWSGSAKYCRARLWRPLQLKLVDNAVSLSFRQHSHEPHTLCLRHIAHKIGNCFRLHRFFFLLGYKIMYKRYNEHFWDRNVQCLNCPLLTVGTLCLCPLRVMHENERFSSPDIHS